jgi:glutamyl-tRNA synthetase
MILGKDKKKLSKRHGATSVFEYGDLGYLPESVFNFLALLGWGPPTGEIFDRTLATELFELSRVTKKAAVFDTDKLNFVNQEHLKALDPALRRKTVAPFWESLGLDPGRYPEKYLEDALSLMGGRGQTTKELALFSDYFLDFSPVKERYDGSDIPAERLPALREFYSAMIDLREWSAQALESNARKWCEERGTPLKDIALPLRWALTGRKVSPGVFEVAELLGRDECRSRLTYFKLL